MRRVDRVDEPLRFFMVKYGPRLLCGRRRTYAVIASVEEAVRHYISRRELESPFIPGPGSRSTFALLIHSRELLQTNRVGFVPDLRDINLHRDQSHLQKS
jgi:hypothetical protein